MNRSIPFFLNVLRGFLMGSADVVPGVSGGTVALIVGVYERLVGAISRFDLGFIGYLRRFELREAARHVDFSFLASLGIGIIAAIVTLGSTMESLLVGDTSRPLTLAAFLGMILGSAIVVLRWIHAPTQAAKGRYSVAGMAAAAFAFWVTGLQASSPTVTLGYVFLCGMIGICAMILPGLSGAYLLLVLGMYSHLTDILHRLPHLEVGFADLTTVSVFAAGCAVGLISFSKALKWLLTNYCDSTMAVLCGLMIGALRKVWPFQTDLSPSTASSLKEKVYESRLPLDGDPILACLAMAGLAMAAVLVIDQLARRHTTDRRNETHDRSMSGVG